MTAQPTRDEAIAAAGVILASARASLIEKSPRESAEAAYVPGGPSVKELEQRICALLGIPDTTAPSAA